MDECLYVMALTSAHKELNTPEYQRQRVKMEYCITGGYNRNYIEFPKNLGKAYDITHLALVNNAVKQKYDIIYNIIKLNEVRYIPKGGTLVMWSGDITISTTFKEN